MDRRYDAYLLRWWHSAGSERAEVQHIQTGERTPLPSLAAACSWLMTQYGEHEAGTAPEKVEGRDILACKES